jgi:hypothetical protein
VSGTVYQLIIARGQFFTDAWHQLSKEEQDRIYAEQEAVFKSLGGEVTLYCESYWANTAAPAWGVAKYPSIEALQEFSAKDLEWFRYTNFETILGTEPETSEGNADDGEAAVETEAG